MLICATMALEDLLPEVAVTLTLKCPLRHWECTHWSPPALRIGARSLGSHPAVEHPPGPAGGSWNTTSAPPPVSPVSRTHYQGRAAGCGYYSRSLALHDDYLQVAAGLDHRLRLARQAIKARNIGS